MGKRRIHYPVCPGCEGQNLDDLSGGAANEGSIPLRYYRCLDCDFHGLTYETWLPPTASLNGLDEDRREQNRQRHRKDRGSTAVNPRKGRRITSDTIEHYVVIHPGQLEAGLAKRIDKIKLANRIVPFEDKPKSSKSPQAYAYPPEVKAKALAMLAQGVTASGVAKMTGVPDYTISRWSKAARDATDKPHNMLRITGL